MGTRAFTMSMMLVALGCGGDGAPNAGDASVNDAKNIDSSKSDASTVPVNHRATAASCPTTRGAGPPTQPYPQGQAAGCKSDSDCTSGQNGRCFPFEGLVGPGGCSYDECFTDSDCGAATPCACRASATDNAANVCDHGSNCAVDSDCGPGGYCSPSLSCGSPARYFCHTPSDTCINDADCPPADDASACARFAGCAFDTQAQHWSCTEITCCPP